MNHKSDTLLLANVFQNFGKMFLKIYKLDPAKFPAPELACQAALQKTGVKLESLTEIDMLLIIEKGIRGGICNIYNSLIRKS